MTTTESDVSVEFGNRVLDLVTDITYKDGYFITVRLSPEGRLYMQVICQRKDAVTGEMGVGKGGKCYLSQFMTDQEIVQNAFGLFKAYEEHECREFFKFRGRRIYGPHISLEALIEVADRTTYRVPSNV
jgi:hypothetical protein